MKQKKNNKKNKKKEQKEQKEQNTVVLYFVVENSGIVVLKWIAREWNDTPSNKGRTCGNVEVACGRVCVCRCLRLLY